MHGIVASRDETVTRCQPSPNAADAEDKRIATRVASDRGNTLAFNGNRCTISGPASGQA